MALLSIPREIIIGRQQVLFSFVQKISKGQILGKLTTLSLAYPYIGGRSYHQKSFRQEYKGIYQAQIVLLEQLRLYAELLQATVMSTVGSDGKISSPVSKQPNPSRVRRSSGIISPPLRKGMMDLDKSAFDKDIKIPAVHVYEDCITPQTLQKFKKFMLKIQGMKPVIGEGSKELHDLKSDKGEDLSEDKPRRKTKKLLINPELVKGDLTHFVEHEIQPDASIISSIGYETVKFTYENWTLNQIIDSVLPDDEDKVSGFSQIGPIIHLNLRDHVLPYKKLIGQVFLDKISNAKTVVNKINIIESKFRNFQMEILAGEPNTVVTVKENRCEFEFDFATVYWNPRLSSEHDRLVKDLNAGDTMYDVFAGVGPFTIPAAKRKVTVLANDLNPDSFKWLEHNVKKNKVTNFVKCFNLDGRAFIQEAASSDILEKICNKDTATEVNCSFSETSNRFHFVMNLPAIAVEFLDSFWGILCPLKDKELIDGKVFVVHVYCFIKDINGFKEKAVQLVRDCLGYSIPDENILNVVFVRNVAPNKEMLRVSFILPIEVLLGERNKPLKRKFSEIDPSESNLN